MLPLEGLRIIDMTRFQAGPVGTTMLSDLGIEVIKVEDPNMPDRGRAAGGQAALSSYFVAHNRNKKSLALNTRTKEGLEILYKLIEKADAFTHNFRPGVVEKAGLDYETLSKINPRLVYGCASGWGQVGPKREHMAVDLAGQASSGMMSVTGLPGTLPQPAGTAVADQITAIYFAYGILAALFTRERTGIGQMVDVSIFGSMIAFQGWEITNSLWTGKAPPRSGRGHHLLSSMIWSAFECSDGHIAIGFIPFDKMPRFYEIIGLSELAKDTRFNSVPNLTQNRDQLYAILDTVFPKRRVAEWEADLAELDSVSLRVNNYLQAAADPQAIANEYITSIQDSEHGEVKVVGLPIRLSKTPGRPQRLPAKLGENNDEILRGMGYSDGQITELREKRIVK